MSLQLIGDPLIHFINIRNAALVLRVIPGNYLGGRCQSVHQQEAGQKEGAESIPILGFLVTYPQKTNQ